MIQLVYFIVLFLSLASSAGAILLADKLKNSYNIRAFEFLFYHTLLYALFGIYGIWGQVLIRTVLERLSVTPDVILAIGQLFPLIGFPFLMLSGFMLLRFAYQLLSRPIGREISVPFFIIYSLILMVFGWASFSTVAIFESLADTPLHLLLLFYTVQDLVIGAWFILFFYKNILKMGKSGWPSQTFRFITLFSFLLLLRIFSSAILYFDLSTAPGYILFYFLSLVIPVIFFYRNVEGILSELNMGNGGTGSWENRLKRQGVSRREKEVVDLICKGKSNQEIADKLFISLQTVKDHTHRIYLKMDIKNRHQLMNLFQSSLMKDKPSLPTNN